ncbi:MAG: MGMT family protein [Fuerstiella sp.]
MANDNISKIEAVVRRIPAGKVATYGQIATLAGLPGNARQVGAVLGNLPDDSGVPWHRVVNSLGRISERGSGTSEGLQRHELLFEGVVFSDSERIDLSVYQWKHKK